jgi:hypothetical protein
VLTLTFLAGVGYLAQRYFWDYYAFAGAIPAALLALPLERRSRGRIGARRTVIGMFSLTVAGAAGLLFHPAGFPLLALGYIGAAGTVLELRDRGGGGRAVPSWAIGGSVVASLIPVLLAPGSATLLLVSAGFVSAAVLPAGRARVHLPRPHTSLKRNPGDRLTTTAAALLAIVMLPLLVAGNGSLALRAGLDPAPLQLACALVGAAGALLALAFWSAALVGARIARLAALIASLAVFVTTALEGFGVIFAAACAVGFSLVAALSILENAPGLDRRVLVTKLALFLVAAYLVARLPTVVYSLYLLPLPAPVEYALYVPVIPLALLLFVLALAAGRTGAPLRPRAG